MVTLQSSRLLSVVALSLVTACSTTPRYQPPAHQVATAILAPVANWNPVPGQMSSPGSAAYGRVSVHNGRFDTQQTFEAWTSAGQPAPSGILDRQQQQEYRQQRQQQYYNQQYQQPRIRYCYDSYSNSQYRC